MSVEPDPSYHSGVITRFLNDAVLQEHLPAEIRDRVLRATGDNFLEAVSRAASLSGCTERIFVSFEALTPEICARWLHHSQRSSIADKIAILACLARIFPFARYARLIVRQILSADPLCATTTHFEDDRVLETLLLSCFRFLSTEPEDFSDLIKPTFLSGLFKHDSIVVRYLAIQCFCIVMRLADDLEAKLVQNYVGHVKIPGIWERKQVDFQFLKLLEESRWMTLENDLKDTAQEQSAFDGCKELSNRFSTNDLARRTAVLGRALVPRDQALQVTASSFVATSTASRNLTFIGQSLLQQKPILVLGHGGSGKSALIHESARLLNKASSMITLHLNEQTDAKSLLGVYTSSASGESFVWQPGVLTKAVQQGRWVLIEDIDKAPSEVLGVLRPIIENGELFLPNRKERIRPADGFRVFATVKTAPNVERARVAANMWVTNERLWTIVQVEEYDSQEIRSLLSRQYPAIESLLTEILGAHQAIFRAYQHDPHFRAVQSRLPSLRDLMKWCRRSDRRIQKHGSDVIRNGMPEQVQIDIFKDGVDCYAAYHNDLNVYQKIAEYIAQALKISPQHMGHLLNSTVSSFADTKTALTIGRTGLVKIATRRSGPTKRSDFAMTGQAYRNMERIAAGIHFAEPLLLVGETGVGKTTQVQYIAELVNQKLTVVNLSQQSEVADLLGGLKPITTRALVVPLADQFNSLFNDTFSGERNKKFMKAIFKAVSGENWTRLILLWQEAIQMANSSLQKPFRTPEVEGEEQSVKRRRLMSKYEPLRNRWAEFASKVLQVRAQVERGDKNHVFAFVEGRLLQAVRSGGWLLLDEINLASADTLDNIIGLLNDNIDERPSLLLTEAGEVERVVAHPNFRIFAAMNPATDTGKKDLAPGIRSRFTEMYVSAGDSDVEDLVNIIVTYLKSALSSDKRAASDLADAYLLLKTLNAQHKLTDGAGDIPHFSIRSLVRCLLYVLQHSPRHGLRRSMYEGFAMSFFTVLSIESEKLALSLLNRHLLSNVKNTKRFLSLQPAVAFDPEEYVAFRHHLVRKGAQKPDLQPHYIRTPSVERSLLNLARATSMHRFPILLQGPTSAGKTSMVEYLARFSGNEFVRVNNHEHTDLQEYLGSYTTNDDDRLEFREGVLVEALRRGHWIVLDELNLAPSDVLEALNRLLDDNRELLIPESQEIVRPHPNFMLFATQNPAGLYGGRKRLSRAFRNRFLELHFDDIPEDELEIILRERAQIAPSFCTQMVQVYKKLSLQRQSTRLFESRNSFATLRDLFRWAARPVDDRQQLAQHGFMLLAERVRHSSERQIVKRTIEDTLNVKVDENELYGEQAVPTVLRGSTDVVWTPAMIRLFVLVSEALKNNEPVLLVGETGCGKTQICQTIAEVFQRTLNIYNAHSNTETGDLIGSQRPVRQRSELAAGLMDSFYQLYTAEADREAMKHKDIDQLISDFATMDMSGLVPATVEETRKKIAAYQSLFAWSDGSLVRAMKSGDHFLLDEISLADDSVLERLNSLLEPSRTILLAEKGPDDNLVVAQSGFQFLATMNPGGDYGKRELSAALRNRLTEIWVPPLSQDYDILPILRSKLGENASRFSEPMLDFAQWFRETMQNSAAAAVPLRSLLAWASFMRRNNNLKLDVSFVHGALMVYIDSLGTNPAGLSAGVTNDAHTARRLCLEKLQGLCSQDVFAIHREVPDLRVTSDSIELGSFSLPRTVGGPSTAELVFEAPTTLRNTMRIIRALQTRRPLLLEGSPGVGKTAIVTALAGLAGKQLTRINLSDQTDLMDLFGADTPSENEKLGRFSWRDGPLLQAMQTGGWVLLDEMNLASQSVLEGLNSCLDHRHEVYIAELDKLFICHPNFTLFAAQNPHHQGGGRKGLPTSFVNRFTVVYADSFEHGDLMLICRRTRPRMPEEQLLAIVNTIYRSEEHVIQSPAFSSGGPWELNLRDVNRWLDLSQEYSRLSPVHHFRTVVAQRFRSSSARKLLDEIKSEQFGHESATSLYHNLSRGVFQTGIAFLDRDLRRRHTFSQGSLSTSHLPYAESIITALNHSWPVVLAGPSGSGKTKLIRDLAALSGARLVEFSMNADVDAMDLIGGFEQYDHHRDVLEIQRTACDLLTNLICLHATPEHSHQIVALTIALEHCSSQDVSETSLLESVESLAKNFAEFGQLSARLSKAIEDSSTSRFVWNDGVLVDAIESGAWLVLDNANLCNASVLDRLNSLLEPGGVLTISEQHISSGTERVVKPHSRFRILLTMDPRYGELSRAMRNRSLELYLDAVPGPEGRAAAPTYPTSADTYRWRHLIQHCSQPLRQEEAINRLDPYVGALSLDEIKLMEEQAMMECVASNAIIPLHDRAGLYVWLPMNWKGFWGSLINNFKYDDNSELASRIRRIDLRNLPMTFAFNDALVRLLAPTFDFKTCARQYLGELQRIQLWRMLNKRSDAAAGLSRNDMTVLQKSIFNEGRPPRRQKGDIVPNIYGFLSALVVHHLRADSMLSPESVAESRRVVSLCTDMVQFSDNPAIDPGIFQAYLQVTRDIMHKLSSSQPSLSSGLRAAMGHIDVQFVLRSGQSLQRMWLKWKPVTAPSQDKLEAQMTMETLLATFDRISKSLPHTRAELAVLRSRLHGALWQTLQTNDSVIHDIQPLSEAVSALQRQGDVISRADGHFAWAFEWMLRKLVIQGKAIADLDFHRLSLFADRSPTAQPQSPPYSSASVVLRQLACYYNNGVNDISFNSGKLLSSLRGFTDKPLGSFFYLQEELEELSKTLCRHALVVQSSTVEFVLHCAVELLSSILICHDDMFVQPARSYYHEDHKLDPAGLSGLGEEVFEITKASEVGYFKDVYRAYIYPVLTLLSRRQELSEQSVASVLTLVSVAALKLFVPDKPFDPAIHPVLVSQQHQRRRAELDAQLDSYRDFQTRFTGQQTGVLTSVLEEDLNALGQPPKVPVVNRPSPSELHLVQEEFTILVRSLLSDNQLDTVTSGLRAGQSGSEVVAAAGSVQAICSRLATRLTHLNRAYDDIVKPVTWLLDSLALGTKLLRRGANMPPSSSTDLMLRNLPLLGGSPTEVTSQLPKNFSNNRHANMAWLEMLVSKARVEIDIEASHNLIVTSFLQVVDQFYDDWKSRLANDQAKAEANLRYYSYRGEDEVAQEAEDSEVASMFPTYDGQNDDFQQSDAVEHDPRETAIKLADFHRKIIGTDNKTFSLVQHISDFLGNPEHAMFSIHSPPIDQILPGAILQIKKTLSQLNQTETGPNLNIYSDSDAVESQKLVSLVRQVKTRFSEIADKWPEHATPSEVIAYSEELLALNISDPIAKLLTMTEKLFEIVSRWQSIASREWSVANLIEDLTNMIVRWRRLELSSWSRLLDVEEKKNEEDANSWYFIAYEAVVYNSRLVVEQGSDVSMYCLELVKVLEEFLKAATFGHFQVRLRLLATFKQTLDTLASQDRRLLPIVQCVSSTLFHYQRYETQVQQTISTGRSQLEKDITEQVKLASWRDTNVQSLRDSAKRSHYKLFKVVKKYRALLAQPLVAFSSQDVLSMPFLNRQGALQLPQIDSQHLQVHQQRCASTIDGWATRPSRLTDPAGAATSIKRLYEASFRAFDVSEEIAAFHSELASNAKELRNQTPKSLNDENSSLVRHLRERKRRLFADILKDVSQMGIRRNLPTTELLQQASTAVVLSCSPDINSRIVNDTTAQVGNAAFHEMLDTMTDVRRAAVEHSDDLTEGETRRAIGLLEGLLSVTTAQRADLATAMSGLQSIHSTLQSLRNIQLCGDENVRTNSHETSSARSWAEKCLVWLPQILDASIQILEFQSTHGEFDIQELILDIQQQMSYLKLAKTELEKQPCLPHGLCTDYATNRIEKISTDLKLFGARLGEWQKRGPNMTYLIQQLIPWTESINFLPEFANGLNGTTSKDSQELDSAVKQVLDSIFVTMQRTASAQSAGPDSADDVGWYTKADKMFKDSIKLLHLQDIGDQLQKITLSLQHLPLDQLPLGISLLVIAAPIIEQYFLVVKHVCEKQLNTHVETCRFGVYLTRSFVSLAKEGFCTPKNASDGQEQQSGKLESGTGLGEGEGAEDISKDIGEDEDLSELAQTNAEKQEGDQEIDKEDNAVDMGADDLEGEMDSGDERDTDDEKGDHNSASEDENEMDEETGSVSDLDPSAVDEKLWDDMQTEAEKESKEMKGNKEKGQKSDDQTAKEDGATSKDDDDEMESSDEVERNENQEDEADNQERPEAENFDPHLQEEQTLDLPEDMQLNGEEEDKDDGASSDGMDDLSDNEVPDQPVPDIVDEIKDVEKENRDDVNPDDEAGSTNEDDGSAEGRSQEDEIMEDQAETEGEEAKDVDTRDNDMQYSLDENEGGDTGTADQRTENANQDEEHNIAGQNDVEAVVNEDQAEKGTASDKQQSGKTDSGRMEQGIGKEKEQRQKRDDTLQKLADVLEQFHQRREILTASEERRQGQLEQDVDMADADFEHLADEEQDADAQALGTASADQVQKIDETKAIEKQDGEADQDLPMPEDTATQEPEQQETIAERFSRLQTQPRLPRETDLNGGLPEIAPQTLQTHSKTKIDVLEEELEEDLVDADLVQQQTLSPLTSSSDAATLWSHCSTRTHALSLLLTEQLRLILAPTTATKLRGDFRTGKRLNIKRIIPYIASGYKRDKIWMRRSVPSKRNYQIMIAVDDSKSMSESGADLLAFETLAMLCKSLSMLEVGELCVVNFGDQPRVRVAHPFGQPFSGADSGTAVFQSFSFQQRGTDVRRLLQQSLGMFEEARLRSPDADLWQLQLIVSDGHCAEHDAIRRLVRAAHAQKIMVVFVIVDAGPDSIIDLKAAVFGRVNPAVRSSEMAVRTKRYLEDFPFDYYVVVREVADLPGVLARVLKGWFESVVNVG